jgi:hypothetical protein
MILSADVSDDYNTDDGTECDEKYVQTREGDLECAGDATPDDIAALKWTLLIVVLLARTRRSGERQMAYSDEITRGY